MDDEKIQEILAMHDAGITVTAIAKEMNLSEQTARRILKDHGKDTTRKPKKDIDADGVVKCYVEGKPVPEILHQYGISYAALYTVLMKYAVPTRKTVDAEVNNIRLDRAVEMYIAGAPLWSIKDETGIAQPTLHSELHKRGTPLRRPRII